MKTVAMITCHMSSNLGFDWFVLDVVIKNNNSAELMIQPLMEKTWPNAKPRIVIESAQV